MSRKRVYRGRILGLSVHRLREAGRLVVREVVEHPGAAAVLAFDEKGKVIMVRQHRFPHGRVLEIPAGTMEKGESPLACARRELLEETGYTPGRLVHLVTYYPSIGYNTEEIHCYLAQSAKPADNPSPAYWAHFQTGQSDSQSAKPTDNPSPDPDEIISVEKIPLNRLLRMIRTGRVRDSKTICAALAYSAWRR